jgi:hypothetical protein
MPRYGYFNSGAPAPQPILRWYDTDALTYKTLPGTADLLAISDAEWDARMTQTWAVDNATLVPYSPPPPSLAQQAAIALTNGLTVSLSGALTLAATTFPTDPTTQTKLAAVATILNTTGAFPGGATVYPMKDTAGVWHSFGIAEYKIIAGAIATFAAALYLIIDGNPTNATSLPAATVALSV